MYLWKTKRQPCWTVWESNPRPASDQSRILAIRRTARSRTARKYYIKVKNSVKLMALYQRRLLSHEKQKSVIEMTDFRSFGMIR